MGLGALVVLGVLFAAGFYLPRRLKIHAGESKATLPAQQSSGNEKVYKPAPAAAPTTAPADVTTTPSVAPPAQIPEASSEGAEKTERVGRRANAGASQKNSAEVLQQQAAAEAEAKAAAAAAPAAPGA